MLLIVHLTFQIIIVGIGFGIGYWLLITSKEQERAFELIGQALGAILIVLALFLAIFGSYYSMAIVNRIYMQTGCPIQRFMNEEIQQNENIGNETQPVTDEQRDENENSFEHEKRPIKSSRSNHA